jgi:hypothetical protein
MLTIMENLLNDLTQELIKEEKKTKENARQNYFAAYTINILIVSSSIAATILVASGIQGPITAIVAAIPAALFGINTTFKFEGKSAWHWRKNKRIKTYLRSLRYQNETVEKISKAFSKFDEELDTEWIAFGNLLDDKQQIDPNQTANQENAQNQIQNAEVKPKLVDKPAETV